MGTRGNRVPPAVSMDDGDGDSKNSIPVVNVLSLDLFKLCHRQGR